MTVPYFTVESIHVLNSLRKNNNREWYRQHKHRVEEFLIAPAREMVVAVGKLLDKMAAGIVADPRIDQSIYRIYRDTRFSMDKTPYKEHLALIWWQNLPEGKLSSPCFYLHITPDNWLWSAGCYRFTPAVLTAYREALLNPEIGPPFKFIAARLRRKGLEFNSPDMKRLPKGYQGPPWTDEWLKRKGLYTWSDSLPINDLNILGPKAAKFLAKQFAEALPFYIWLRNLFNVQPDRALEGIGPADGGLDEDESAEFFGA
ncbi:MAG: DUF2461 domain-containing protein [Deltaproteobacteria bacterium]|jgi:uncharacterized protein (TIGR02453 family)|nr:DUF2461 domain-containing protein [Deltaproteobacteria bacterium]